MELILSVADHIAYAAADVQRFLTDELTRRDVVGWLWFFMPVFLLCEVPRYVLPTLILPLLKWWGALSTAISPDAAAKRAFLARRPTVSVLLVGYNEEDSIVKAITSLLELPYPLEIVVVDDNSTDRMHALAMPFAQAGQILLYKNTASTGRGGRPAASNLALHLSTGEFILSVDADTSFDRDTIEHMIGPFHDPAVGVVAGNLMPRNASDSIWARMQAIEYIISIGLWKRWLGLFGMNLQASGAFGAFRRTALVGIGAWDPELAEDADLSLKARKAGWGLVFAPEAIAMTNVPTTMRVLVGQRVRWDKGMLRTYFRKHVNIIDPRIFAWRIASEMLQDFFFSVVCGYLFMIYVVWTALADPALLAFALVLSYVVYWVLSSLSLLVGVLFSKRPAEDLRLLPWALFFPAYKEFFRWIRIYALTLELLHVNYDETYLPQSAWRNTPRW